MTEEWNRPLTVEEIYGYIMGLYTQASRDFYECGVNEDLKRSLGTSMSILGGIGGWIRHEELSRKQPREEGLNFGKCHNCGQEILWIKTVRGKNMPCDPDFIFTGRAIGTMTLTTKEGESFNTDGPKAHLYDGGYNSHFGTCGKR